MTSASELFHNLRSRAGRNPEPELGLDPPPTHHPDLRRPRRRRGLRRPQDPEHPAVGRSHAGGPPSARHLCHRAAHPAQEREPVRFDNSGPSEYGNISGSEATSSSRVNRLSLTRHDRLPGAVLQAQARLFERLRGISLRGSRQTTTAPSITWDELAVSDEFRLVNYGDWETEISNEWLESFLPFTDLDVEGNRSSLQHVSKKKPQGLSSEAFRSLPQEIFKHLDANGVIGTPPECCICLETFWEGDGLIRLRCSHRFHPDCIEPWVRTCGDCPYCRASI